MEVPLLLDVIEAANELAEEEKEAHKSDDE